MRVLTSKTSTIQELFEVSVEFRIPSVEKKQVSEFSDNGDRGSPDRAAARREHVQVIDAHITILLSK